MNAHVVLPITGPYTPKDQKKSSRATKFIGRGTPGSSTAAYARAWGDRANCGEYDADDVVFVSSNGARPRRVAPQWGEIAIAMLAGATILTDVPEDRARGFNVGEREVAAFLSKHGYTEVQPGAWRPV